MTFNTVWNHLINRSALQHLPDNDLIRFVEMESRWYDRFRPVINDYVDRIATQGDNRLSVLDAGCGLGLGFASVALIARERLSRFSRIDYVGIDLIDTSSTRVVLQRIGRLLFPKSEMNIQTLRQDLAEASSGIAPDYDLIVALGSLHHTPSVRDSLIKTSLRLGRGATFLGWIINEQKPLRSATDEYFRRYFQNLVSEEECVKELRSLAKLFESLRLSLGESTILIDEGISSLGLEPGRYRAQSLLYDFILKCYATENAGIERAVAQLYDWFKPSYYHQTSREQLASYLGAMTLIAEPEIISDTNGHFFAFQRLD